MGSPDQMGWKVRGRVVRAPEHGMKTVFQRVGESLLIGGLLKLDCCFLVSAALAVMNLYHVR